MKQETLNVLLPTITGVVGTIFGVVLSSNLNRGNEIELARIHKAVDAYRYEHSDQPDSEDKANMKMFFAQLQNITIGNREAIIEFADLFRAYPHCATELSEDCRTFFIKHINISRTNLGLPKVPEKDIEIILKPHFDKVAASAKAKAARGSGS